jgi:hypothetical protein
MWRRILRYAKRFPTTLLLISIFLVSACLQEKDQDSKVYDLRSWNEGKVKTAITSFVKEVTDKNNPNYIPPTERIATFDNDGTLWSEQPAYFQLFFAIDRVKELALQHPEWKTTQP